MGCADEKRLNSYLNIGGCLLTGEQETCCAGLVLGLRLEEGLDSVTLRSVVLLQQLSQDVHRPQTLHDVRTLQPTDTVESHTVTHNGDFSA